MNANWRLITAACAVMVSVGIAYVVWKPARRTVNVAIPAPQKAYETTAVPAETPPLPDNYETAYPISVKGLSAEEAGFLIAESVRQAIKPSESTLPVGSGADALASEVGSFVACQLADSPQVLFSKFEQLGISKPEIAENPKFSVYFQRAGDLLREARLNPSAIVVRSEVVSGVSVVQRPTPEEAPVTTARRDQGRPAIEKLAKTDRNEFEVVLPMILRTIDGVPFAGKVGLVFAWDPQSKKWVPVASRIYSAPMGQATAMLIV